MSKTNDTVSGQLLDVKQVADTLNCSIRTVQRLADSGKMPRPLRLGKLNRWSPDTINDWIEAGCKPVKSLASRRQR
jgi:excisionase family DNA binding protein